MCAVFTALTFPASRVTGAGRRGGSGGLLDTLDVLALGRAAGTRRAGAGGALTRGKYAPSLQNTTPKHIYEAMVSGPQSMPVPVT